MKSLWHRKADSVEERYGLLDPVTASKYKRHPVYQAPSAPRAESDLTAIGLTSGIGSMLVGASQLGFEVLGNIEWRDYYRFRNAKGQSTFPANFPRAFMARGLADVPPELIPQGVTFAAGHPECGRYSRLSGTTQGAFLEGKGSDVSDIPIFLDLVARIRPRFFLMDNLPASLGPLPIHEYIEALPDYDLFPEWVSNWGYGNIQKHRNRMFIIGALKTEKFVFIPGEADHQTTLADVIGQVRCSLNHAGVDPWHRPYQYPHLRRRDDRPTWEEIRRYYQSNPETLTRDIPYVDKDGAIKKRPGTISPAWDGWCPTFNGGFTPLHPVYLRPMTIRERALVQGFPEDFVFHYDEGDPTDPQWEPCSTNGHRGIRQTGKAMPVQFCTYVAQQVKAHVQGQDFPATGQRLLKPNPKVTQAKEDFCLLSGYADQAKACGACWHRAKCPVRRGFISSINHSILASKETNLEA